MGIISHHHGNWMLINSTLKLLKFVWRAAVDRNVANGFLSPGPSASWN